MKPVSDEVLALAGVWSTLLDLTIVAALLVAAIDAWAPPQDLPWKPLRLERPIGHATRLQFERAAGDPAACRRALRAGGVAFADEPDRTRGDCATADTVRLRDPSLAPADPILTCPAALGYALWMRHVVQPAARAELGASTARVEHLGTYACRNLYGQPATRRSEHAFANALDVAGLRTTRGERISVVRDFDDPGPKGRFLRRVRDGACPWFRAVLSPDYNASHSDHLHLDRGQHRLCR